MPAKSTIGTVMNSGMTWFDMALNFQREMQRASLQALSSYSPSSDTRITGELPRQPEGVLVVPVGEERLNVATTTVQGGPPASGAASSRGPSSRRSSCATRRSSSSGARRPATARSRTC